MKNFTKATLILVALLCFSQLSIAQTVNQGAWMVGGSAALDITKFKEADESTTSFFLNPALGYFVADDLALGVNLSIFDSGVEGAETISGLGVFGRYYVSDPIFIQAAVDLELNEGGGTAFGASVGYSWFLNSGVAIEPALYFWSYGNDGDFLDYTSFGLSIGIQAFAGRNE